MGNVTENRLLAYQQYIEKLEKRVSFLVNLAIILSCTTLISFAYIVWSVL